MLIHKNMKLSEVVHHDHTLVPIINRFGIHLGFGDNTITEICQKHGLNVDFFVTILNAFHDIHYFPKEQLRNFSVALLIDYLQKAHRSFLEEKIPEISLLIKNMTEKCPLDVVTSQLITNFFKEYTEELKKHIRQEEETIYPYVLLLEKVNQNLPVDEGASGKINHYSISAYKAEHEDVEEKLFDLKNILIKYLPGQKNDKPVYQLLRELFSLEKDLNEHARIEDMILIPKVEAMEKTLRNKNPNGPV